MVDPRNVIGPRRSFEYNEHQVTEGSHVVTLDAVVLPAGKLEEPIAVGRYRTSATREDDREPVYEQPAIDVREATTPSYWQIPYRMANGSS